MEGSDGHGFCLATMFCFVFSTSDFCLATMVSSTSDFLGGDGGVGG